MKNKNEVVLFESNAPTKRNGFFEEGIDGRGNPYEKKYYPNEDVYTKQEKLKSGKIKSTVIK